MKKCLLIGMTLLLILGGVGCSCGGDQGEKPTGTIQVPDGPEIEVVLTGEPNWPSELEVTWEKLEVVGFELCSDGTLTNAYNQTIKFSTINFLLDGQQKAFNYGQTLKPGEKMKINARITGYTENSEELEVKIKGFQKLGDPTTEPVTPVPATPKPTTPKPTTPEPVTPKLVTPEPATEPEMTPEEVIALWLKLLKEGRFAEAEELYTLDGKEDIEVADGLKKVWKANPIQEIQITKTNYEGPKNTANEAHVYVVFCLVDGSQVSNNHFNFRKIDGQWKIDDLFGCYPGLD